MKKSRVLSFLVTALVLLPSLASAQVVVRTNRRGTRVTTAVGPRGGVTTVVNPPGPGRVVVGPRGGVTTVVNPPGPGNRTAVHVGPRGNAVINPPGPGRVVVRHR